MMEITSCDFINILLQLKKLPLERKILSKLSSSFQNLIKYNKISIKDVSSSLFDNFIIINEEICNKLSLSVVKIIKSKELRHLEIVKYLSVVYKNLFSKKELYTYDFINNTVYEFIKNEAAKSKYGNLLFSNFLNKEFDEILFILYSITGSLYTVYYVKFFSVSGIANELPNQLINELDYKYISIFLNSTEIPYIISNETNKDVSAVSINNNLGIQKFETINKFDLLKYTNIIFGKVPESKMDCSKTLFILYASGELLGNLIIKQKTDKQISSVKCLDLHNEEQTINELFSEFYGITF